MVSVVFLGWLVLPDPALIRATEEPEKPENPEKTDKPEKTEKKEVEGDSTETDALAEEIKKLQETIKEDKKKVTNK